MIATFAAFLFMDDHLFGFLTIFFKKTTGPQGDVDLAIWQNSPIAK
jgi:hypothetical protein